MRARRLCRAVAVASVLLAASACDFPFLSSLTSTTTAPQSQSTLSCPSPTDAGAPLTLVVGARANSPQPQLPDQIKTLLGNAVAKGSKIQVVRVDGQPGVALGAAFDGTKDNNDAIRKKDRDTFTNKVLGYVAGLRPKQPEADVLAALTEAANATPTGGTIVLLDSGIATKGQLNFVDSDMFDVDPAEAVKFLQDQHLMPDLSGRSVVLAGLGMTADPEPALDQNLRSRVTGLWHAVVAAANAGCVYDLPTTPSRTAVDTTVPVAVVPLPKAPVFHPCGTTILADSDTVGFVPNQAVFRDPGAARGTLQGLADQLRGGKQKVTLTGTTATAGNSEPDRVTLSKERAGAVMDVLVSLGVDAGRITTVGAGTHGPNHINDIGPSGELLPGPAAQNRSVVVDLACPQT